MTEPETNHAGKNCMNIEYGQVQKFESAKALLAAQTLMLATQNRRTIERWRES